LLIWLLGEDLQGAFEGAKGFENRVWCDSGGAEVSRPSCPHIFPILCGITIFTGKSQWAVDVVYLRYFRDFDLVAGYSWGAAALAHLYKELNNVARWNFI